MNFFETIKLTDHEFNKLKLEKRYEIILNYFKPTAQAQKTNAEFLTPLVLAQEMCNKIPAEFFTAPKKVFDPCCGKGVFPLVIYDLFWKNLTIENADEKHRVILEDCLYFMDINPFNIFITKYLLDPLNQYKLNYSCGDTLKLKIEEEFKLEGFDAVVGNPPFQKNFKNQNGRVGGSSLWSEFINKTFKFIYDGGYLLFITPCSWMTGGSNKQSGNILNGVFKQNNIIFLNIEECNRYFDVASTFSYYLIQKSNIINSYFKCVTLYKKNIYISNIDQNIFRNLDIVPKLLNRDAINIINKLENKNNNKFKLERLRDLDSSARLDRYDQDGKYKVRHKVVEIKYTNYLQVCMNKPKIIISMPGYIKPIYDKECGCSDASLFMYVETEIHAEKLIKLLNYKLYTFIINNYRELTGLNNHKKINKLCIPHIDFNSDEDLYNYFNLNKDEIKLIEQNIKLKK